MTSTAAGLRWRLAVHEVLPSTSDLCRTLAERGEPEGLAVLARRQSQGRGTRGRNWETPTGNLALSFLLRPRLPLRVAAQISLLVAVALAEAVALLVAESARLVLKWPNDLLLDGGKLSGILLDSRAVEGETEWVVVGVGVNLAVAPLVSDRRVACLADVTAPPEPDAFAEALLARVGVWYRVLQDEGFAPVRQAWLARALPVGAAMTLRLAGRLHAGSFAGLEDDGTLILHEGGMVRRFVAGEVLLAQGGA